MLSQAGKLPVNALALVFLHIGSSTFLVLCPIRSFGFKVIVGKTKKLNFWRQIPLYMAYPAGIIPTYRGFCGKEPTVGTLERSGSEGIL
jgi:hypothetical protein